MPADGLVPWKSCKKCHYFIIIRRYPEISEYNWKHIRAQVRTNLTSLVVIISCESKTESIRKCLYFAGKWPQAADIITWTYIWLWIRPRGDSLMLVQSARVYGFPPCNLLRLGTLQVFHITVNHLWKIKWWSVSVQSDELWCVHPEPSLFR